MPARDSILTRLRPIALAGLALLFTACVEPEPEPEPEPDLPTLDVTHAGSYRTGSFDTGAAEIVSFDPATKRLFVVNGESGDIDIIDIHDPAHPIKVGTISVSGVGVPNSVSVKKGVVAVALAAVPHTDRGHVGFYDTDGSLLSLVEVGYQPDMVLITPDGKTCLVANEGEPSADYSIDPEGSVSAIDLSAGAPAVTQADHVEILLGGVPVTGTLHLPSPAGTALAKDLEPEYIAVSPDGKTAYVTLQENNGVLIVDVASRTALKIVSLGTKDHSIAGQGLDPSDRDGAIAIATHPVRGMYQPDGIAAYEVDGAVYFVTANEGDARDYDGYSEESRVKKLSLDAAAFPASTADDAALGRLAVSAARGDVDGDGDHDVLYAFGTRSFSIWDASGELVWDSGDQFAKKIVELLPNHFNASDSDNDSKDSRSDNKGCEPESVVVGKVGDRWYAYIGLERQSMVLIYDVTAPESPTFVDHVDARLYSGAPEADTAGDLSPEGLLFVPATESPTGKALLVTANEVSGSTSVYEVSNGTGDVTPPPAPKVAFTEEAMYEFLYPETGKGWTPARAVVSGTLTKTATGGATIAGLTDVGDWNPVALTAMGELWDFVLKYREWEGVAKVGPDENGTLRMGPVRHATTGEAGLLVHWNDIDDSSYAFFYVKGADGKWTKKDSVYLN